MSLMWFGRRGVCAAVLASEEKTMTGVFKWVRRLFKPPKATLIAMRTADMVFVHPLADFSRHCSKCEEEVGIYPSGQSVIKEHGEANVEIVCNRCMEDEHYDTMQPAPGALEEIGQSIRRRP